MSKETKETPVLAYWDIRGLAQPIRLLLEYTGTKFEDKYYKCGPAPDFDKSCWFDNKFKLGLDFPNLPYFIDGDIKVTQSNAIMRYIARKHDLCGKTEKERVRVDILENQIMDIRNGLVQLSYDPNFEKLKPKYLEAMPGKLKLLSDFLGENKWFAGDNITFPDFIVYEILDHHRDLSPDILKDTPNLEKFMDRFEALEPIKKYMSSKKFLKSPINNKMAKISYK
ncbi:Glutathione S-transferase Mu 3 [Armadillidium nasatum]|uniref:Glutathione S-transferase n=1 Tax=Armadillidium nasatum TaxID=96803 RepID=A0A5N5THB5_9CRUS|nr:Glutathione S-transferase Mu 3 [Armadillidium nasatum]